jgi:hypothetical protein
VHLIKKLLYCFKWRVLLMKNNTTAGPTAKPLFPSDQFLRNHFGDDMALEFNSHRGEIPTQLHNELRRRFKHVFFSLPVHFMQEMNRSEGGFSRAYVFRDGAFGDLVNLALDQQGLPELSPRATAELCVEFSHYCQQDDVGQGKWWRWQVDGTSVWLEVIPAAIAAGKNKRRTLADILGKA